MTTLHLTSGDIVGLALRESNLPGEVYVWHDILYDGPRKPGWPDEGTLHARASFLEETTGGGLNREQVLLTLMGQYRVLRGAEDYERVVLCFDACLFDQSMLVHVLTCLDQAGCRDADILCIDAFPGIEPFHGLGQMTPEQLASCYANREPATDAQFAFAAEADTAFALDDPGDLGRIAGLTGTALPHVPAAAARRLQEEPDPETGLGRLEQLIVDVVGAGHQRPKDIFTAVSAADTPPQYWGDTTLWAKINGLAHREPPLLRIDGPADRMPQWVSDLDLGSFRITIHG